MKKVFLIILGVLVAAAAAVAGYLLLTGNQAKPQQENSSSQVAFAQLQMPALPASPGVAAVDESFYEISQALAVAVERNSDTVAWLQVPGTDINNSVLQSNNNFYYLRRNEQKQDDIYGCYFTDYASSFENRASISPNTVIYGHSDLKDNPDGPRFSQLFRFTDMAIAQENRYLYFATPTEQLRWQIFAVFYADTGFDYITPDVDAAGLEAIAREAMARSLYQYGVEVTGEDKIITLSTCTVKYGERKDQRFVVMAKLLPGGAATPQGVPLVATPNPKQPTFATGG